MPYGVTFARIDAANLEVIDPLVQHLVALASEFGGMYYGWGCQAQTPG